MSERVKKNLITLVITIVGVFGTGSRMASSVEVEHDFIGSALSAKLQKPELHNCRFRKKLHGKNNDLYQCKDAWNNTVNVMCKNLRKPDGYRYTCY